MQTDPLLLSPGPASHGHTAPSLIDRIGAARWLLACGGGELVGFVAAALWIRLAIATFGVEPATDAARAGTVLFATAGGACEGALLGALQFLALRRAIPELRASGFVGATMTVAALGWWLGMLPSTLASSATAATLAFDPPSWLVGTLAAAMDVATGAAFGAAQWLALRRYAAGSWHWISGNAVGWGLALPFSFLAGSLGDSGHDPGVALALAAVAGLTMGGIVAVATAVAMRRMIPAS